MPAMTPPLSPLLRRLALLAAAIGLAACAGPRPAQDLTPPAIIAVEAWGGNAPAEPPARPQRISHITLHHQGETWTEGADVAAYLRRLQQWSRLSKRWADIPYHYVIAPDGRIYAARPENRAGDTNTGYDPTGHALVMVLGNFEEVKPNAAQLRAVVDLMASLAATHGLAPDRIGAHKDYSAGTVCPGANLYPYVQSGWLRRAVAARLAGSRELPPPL